MFTAGRIWRERERERERERGPYFGTKTMKPFALIFTILASVSTGLHDKMSRCLMIITGATQKMLVLLEQI
jgi:hypothetical protein